MTRQATRPAPARTAAACAVVPGLMLALIAGLVWMHALSGHHTAAAPVLAHHGSVESSVPGDGASVASAEPCGRHGRPAGCPNDHTEHPGPLCRSAAVPGAAVPAEPGPGVLMPAGPPTPEPATVAGDAGAGSGCGPPSLTLLSISRP